MSNLEPWLRKRRGLHYEGEQLERAVRYFLGLVEKGAQVLETKDSIIVLVPYGFPGNVKAYLLFERFTRGLVRDIQAALVGTKHLNVYTSSHDVRIRNLLVRLGFTQYEQSSTPVDYFLVKEKENVLHK